MLRSLFLAIVLTTVTVAGLPLTGGPVTALAADKDIVVLYTNDVHCGVDDNIGYAGLALYKKEMQQQTPYVTGGYRGRHSGSAHWYAFRRRVSY